LAVDLAGTFDEDISFSVTVEVARETRRQLVGVHLISQGLVIVKVRAPKGGQGSP
jgi:outer membrane receptor protein involved in Fe transport